MDLDIRIKDFNNETFSIIKFNSYFNDFNKASKEAINWLKSQENLKNKQKNYIFNFNKSLKTGKILVEAMFPIIDKSKISNTVRIVREMDHKVVSCVSKGNIDDVRSAYILLREYYHNNDMEASFFPKEFYINNPLGFPGEEWLNEIQIPVIDFKPNPDVKLENVGIKKTKSRQVAFIQHNGPMSEEFLVKKELEKWIDDNNIEHEEHYLKFVTHPDVIHPNKNIFEVGVFIKPNQEISHKNDNVRIFNSPPHLDIIGTYKGPYKDLASAHRLIRIFGYNNDLENTSIPMEVYLNDPFEVETKDLLTEIRLPVTEFKLNRNMKFVSPPSVKIIKNREIVFIRNQGPILEIENVRKKLNKWIEKNNIKVFDHHFVRYFLHPLSIFSQEMYFDVGYLLNNEIEEDSTKIIEISEHKFLSTFYKGSYENLKEVIEILREYGLDNGLNLFDFHREIYFNKVSQSDESELVTEIQIPIQII